MQGLFVKQHFPECQIPDDLFQIFTEKLAIFYPKYFSDDLFLSIIPFSSRIFAFF